MGHVERIAQDLSDEQWERQSAGHDFWTYGTKDTAELHAMFRAELRKYPDEVGVTCDACGKLQHVSLTITCQECGQNICISHSPTCPHKEASR
jgi:hypothetical protein